MDSEVGQFPTQYQGGARNSPSVCLLVTPACCRELKDFPPRPDGSPVQGIGIRSLLAKWKLGRHGLICSGAAILPSQFIVTTSLQRYMLKPLQHQNGVHLQHAAKGARFLGVISFLVHSRECGLCPSAVSLCSGGLDFQSCLEKVWNSSYAHAGKIAAFTDVFLA